MSENVTMVILGASGDLTRRKLVPALYGLYLKGRLPANTYIVGFPHRELSRDELLAGDDHVRHPGCGAHMHER